MLKKNAITFWITLFFFIMALPAYSGILDGKTFVGKNGEIGKKSSEDDEIKFENGKFFSVGCGKYGFGDAEYTTKADGDRVFLPQIFTAINTAESPIVGLLKAMTLMGHSFGSIRENMINLNR